MTTRELIGTGFRRATRWRLLLLCAVLTAIPAALATLPLYAMLSSQLGHSPRLALLDRGMELSWLPDVLHVLADGGAQSGPAWLLGVLVGALLLGPALAGAVLAEAGSPHPLRFRPLLTGVGRYYGRMLRTVVVGAIPLGLAGGVVAVLARRSGREVSRAVTEAAAVSSTHTALLLGGLVLVVAHLTVDAGRAGFAVQPDRRSALLCWFRGTWLVLRHPVRSAVIAGAGLLAGPGLGLVVMAFRERLPAGPAWATVASVLLAQVAVMAIGWGRAARVIALVQLARDDREARLRRAAARPPAPDAPAPDAPATDAPEPAPEPEP